MTTQVMIILIVACTIVAVTLIGGITAIIRSIYDARHAEANAYILHEMNEMGVRPNAEEA